MRASETVQFSTKEIRYFLSILNQKYKLNSLVLIRQQTFNVLLSWFNNYSLSLSLSLSLSFIHLIYYFGFIAQKRDFRRD